MRVVVIGSGSVAEALAIAIARRGGDGLELTQIFGRNRLRVNEIARLAGCENAKSEPQDLAQAELYILAGSDRAIAQLATELPFAKGAIVAHTAGSVALDALTKNDDLERAVIYPMQTFTKGRRVDFKEIPICVEADDVSTLNTVKEMAKILSDNVIELSSERRKQLHLAAIFANNFTNAMFNASHDILSKNELPLNILEPLIKETIAKAMLPNVKPIEMQSGPAVRADHQTMKRHEELLEGSAELIELYKTISKYIWETSKRI